MLVAGLAVVSAGGHTVAPAVAQDVPAAEQRLDDLLNAFPEGMTGEQIDAVLAVADAGEVRAALRERLMAEMGARRAAAAIPPPQSLLDTYSARLAATAAAYPRLPQGLAEAVAGRSKDSATGLARLVGGVAFILAAGAAAMIALRLLLVRWRRQLTGPLAGGRGNVAARLVLRLAFDVLEIGAFLLGGVIAYAILRPAHAAAPAVLFIVLRAATIVLLGERIARFLCDPKTPKSRLVHIADAEARGLYRAVISTMLVTVVVLAAVQIVVALDLPSDEVVAFALPLSILPFAYLLFLVWRRRSELTTALARWLRLEGEHSYVAGALVVLGAAYLVGLWLAVVDAVLRTQPAIGMKAIASLILVFLVPVVAGLIHRPIARFYGLAAAAPATAPPPQDEFGDFLPVVGPAEQQPATGTAGHVSRLMRAVWAVLIVLAIIITARLWGFDPERHAGLGVSIVRLMFDISVVLLIGYIGWALIVHSIDQALERARAEGRTTRAQRMMTLLPLLRKFLQVVLLAIVVMIVLSAMGVDIGPLLAGAGVVGLAIGLGTQQTIADIVAGVFFLAEDAFRVGDYVEAGSMKGRVEGISLRSLKLRHQRGAVHTLPFGQIKSLTNHTRDWALVRLEFRVAPDTDIALLKRLVKAISKDLATDPTMGPSFIEPLKSQGIRSVEDGSLIIGIKYITRPGEQFVIRREAYDRITAAFKEHGIELVGRSVVVRVDKTDTATREVAGAAAAEALHGRRG
jgi:small-conductance mechanosensitive channel